LSLKYTDDVNHVQGDNNARLMAAVKGIW